MKTALLSFILLLACAAFAQSRKATKANATASHPSAPVASSLYRMQEGFIDAHGVLIYYKIIGQGAPLMIVHGGPGASHDYLLPYLLPLMRGNQLIFIDERGS